LRVGRRAPLAVLPLEGEMPGRAERGVRAFGGDPPETG
jgi:hypothetical protein